MSNAHVNHKHGVTMHGRNRPKSSNSKKRNKALAKTRKATVLAHAASKKTAQLKQLGAR